VTTRRKAEANRKNALVSRGPKTLEGKSRASKNATRHGVLSALAVVPGLERAQDWEAHLAGIMAALAPAGRLETLLAERVALTSWRLLRVARYEREAVSLGLEDVEEDAAEQMRTRVLFSRPRDLTNPVHPDDARFFARLAGETLRERERFYADLWKRNENEPVSQEDALEVLESLAKTSADFFKDGNEVLLETIRREGAAEAESVLTEEAWTVGDLRSALDAVAATAETSTEELIEADLGRLRIEHSKARFGAKEAGVTVDRLRRSRIVPSENVLQKVARYEAHLERALYRALHELQRLQAVRGGAFVPPPAAVDVNLSVSASEAVA
jgi:hypothetical protein